MGGVSKVIKKIHKSVQDTDLGSMALKGAVGKKNYDKIHFLGTNATKQADAIDQAKADKKTAEQLAAEARAAQATQIAELDDEENRRIKKLLTGSRGMRGYRGGSMFRQAPSNSAGARSAAGSGSASPGAAAMRAGGARGGLGSFRSNSPQP
jgi:hypothetical protein